MQDLKNKYFKNIHFKNMFFINNSQIWDRYSFWFQKSEEESKQLFRSWIKNQIQKFSANAIVMMDEFCATTLCNREKYHQDPSNIILDVDFLAEYENIRFVICVSPEITDYSSYQNQNSFDLNFYNGSEKATFHHLSGRYRNTAGILQFINFVADNFHNIYRSWCIKFATGLNIIIVIVQKVCE